MFIIGLTKDKIQTLVQYKVHNYTELLPKYTLLPLVVIMSHFDLIH